MRDYKQFIEYCGLANPSIRPLSQYLSHSTQKPSLVLQVKFTDQEPVLSNHVILSEASLTHSLHLSGCESGSVLIIEDIAPSLLLYLGEQLDIDPIFFANHIITEHKDLENNPSPPSLALFPSQLSQRGHLHIHYQQVVDFGTAPAFTNSTYALKSDSNVSRNIRRLPSLSGRHLGLARGCFSICVVPVRRSWIGTL